MERITLPRPPKDLRVVELWGVEEHLLHSPTRMSEAIDQIIMQMRLHPIEDTEAAKFGFTPHGLSYVKLLKESHIAGHTYFEQDGHLDLQLSTCTEGLDLDPLALVTRSVFKPARFGICYQVPYPQFGITEDREQMLPVQQFEFSTTAKIWTIAPYA